MHSRAWLTIALAGALVLLVPATIHARPPLQEGVLQSNDVSVRLPGKRWHPIDKGALSSHRATSNFVGAARHDHDAVVAVLFVQPWESVPRHPTTAEEMDEYLEAVTREITAERADVAVLDRDSGTADGLVVGRLHVLRNADALSRDLGWSEQYAIHQLSWSVATESGLLQLYIYIRDDDHAAALISRFSDIDAYRFEASTASSPNRTQKRSWTTVLFIFIGLLAVALLGLRFYQRHRLQSRQQEADVETNQGRPTPVTLWEDDLDEIFDKD